MSHDSLFLNGESKYAIRFDLIIKKFVKIIKISVKLHVDSHFTHEAGSL